MQNDVSSNAPSRNSNDLTPLWLDSFLAVVLLLAALPVAGYTLDRIRTAGLLDFASCVGFSPYMLIIWSLVYLPCKVATTKRRTALWLVTAILFAVIFFGCPIMHIY